MRAPFVVHVTTVPMTYMLLKAQIRRQLSAGFEVALVSSPGKELEGFGALLGASVFEIPMSRSITPLSDLRALWAMWRLLRSLEPDVVDAHTPKAGLLATLAASLAGVRIRIFHVHGLPATASTGLLRYLHCFTAWASCKSATRVLAVSRSIRCELVTGGMCPAHKVSVLANGSSGGVNAERFSPRTDRHAVRAQLGIPSHARVIGFVGRLVPEKGVVELADAWTVLRGKYPEAHLVLAGPLEPHTPLPADTLRRLRVDERVHLTGMVDAVERIYGALDVVCLPTYREGLPNVALEAAAMELPVVATSVPGCVDAVVDGVTGTLIPPRDPAAIVGAVSSYLDDDVLARSHGSAGRRHVRENFEPDAIEGALLAEYKRLLAGEATGCASNLAEANG